MVLFLNLAALFASNNIGLHLFDELHSGFMEAIPYFLKETAALFNAPLFLQLVSSSYENGCHYDTSHASALLEDYLSHKGVTCVKEHDKQLHLFAGKNVFPYSIEGLVSKLCKVMEQKGIQSYQNFELDAILLIAASGLLLRTKEWAEYCWNSVYVDSVAAMNDCYSFLIDGFLDGKHLLNRNVPNIKENIPCQLEYLQVSSPFQGCLLKSFDESIFYNVDGFDEEGYFVVLKNYFKNCKDLNLLSHLLKSYPAFWNSLLEPLEITSISSGFICIFSSPIKTSNLTLSSLNHIASLLQPNFVLGSVQELIIKYNPEELIPINASHIENLKLLLNSIRNDAVVRLVFPKNCRKGVIVLSYLKEHLDIFSQFEAPLQFDLDFHDSFHSFKLDWFCHLMPQVMELSVSVSLPEVIALHAVFPNLKRLHISTVLNSSDIELLGNLKKFRNLEFLSITPSVEVFLDSFELSGLFDNLICESLKHVTIDPYQLCFGGEKPTGLFNSAAEFMVTFIPSTNILFSLLHKMNEGNCRLLIELEDVKAEDYPNLTFLESKYKMRFAHTKAIIQ